MKKIGWLVLLISTITLCRAQELQQLYSDAMIAYRNKNYTGFYTHIKQANILNPYHEGILYQLGIAAALTGKKEEAIHSLRQAILINADFRLEGIADFKLIKESKEFNSLIALQKEGQTPVINSEIAFKLKDRSIHPEPIAYDAAHHVFFLGSIHQRKVIKVLPNGSVTDFCSQAYQGMGSVMGLKADTLRNLLWVCSSPLPEMMNYDSTLKPLVFKFDLATGHLLHQFIAPKKGVYGDLILSSKGKVYLSDSETNELSIVNEKTNQIEPFFYSSEFISVQGITLSSDEKSLFIADYEKGIFKLDLHTKKLNLITTAKDVSLKGIDGIYFYRHSLVAIQNGVVPARSVRYELGKGENTIIDFKIIDRKHPDFGEPTLGVITGNMFYYIANSQWAGYDTRHQQKPASQLKEVVVLKSALR
ncbi:MAG: hypothetical protein JSS93_09280 [Bacteroidetes bacterium]|nr:hypothetical protein [Bacteroidota bacterium]